MKFNQQDVTAAIAQLEDFFGDPTASRAKVEGRKGMVQFAKAVVSLSNDLEALNGELAALKQANSVLAQDVQNLRAELAALKSDS